MTTDREQHSTRAFLLNRFVLHYTELWETAYSATSILSSALVWTAVSLRARVRACAAAAADVLIGAGSNLVDRLTFIL